VRQSPSSGRFLKWFVSKTIRLLTHIFYEPFSKAFDPELRKELGVWYGHAGRKLFVIRSPARRRATAKNWTVKAVAWLTRGCLGARTPMLRLTVPISSRCYRANSKRLRGAGLGAPGSEHYTTKAAQERVSALNFTRSVRCGASENGPAPAKSALVDERRTGKPNLSTNALWLATASPRKQKALAGLLS